MTYDEYTAQYDQIDHLLIRMKADYPYFQEKRIIENGIERIEKNYHVTNGMFANYINYEVPYGLAALISQTIRFEISNCPTPIFITNVDAENIELYVENVIGILHPGEVLPIYPKELSIDTVRQFEGERYERYCELKLSQSVFYDLLGRWDQAQKEDDPSSQKAENTRKSKDKYDLNGEKSDDV